MDRASVALGIFVKIVLILVVKNKNKECCGQQRSDFGGP